MATRWNATDATHTLSITENIDNGESVEPRYATRRQEFPIDGLSVTYSDRAVSVLYAGPSYDTRPIVGLSKVAKIGDTIRVTYQIDGNDLLTRNGIHRDVATLSIFRADQLVAELAFDDRVTDSADSSYLMATAY